MKKFYVSLTKDLIGCYLQFDADSEFAVRAYLTEHYTTKGDEWKLPWCAVYEEIPEIEGGKAIVIPARCGQIFEADYN